MELYQNKNWLDKKYWNKELSITQIAKLCGCARSTIWCSLHKMNIKTRSQGEAEHLIKVNHCNLMGRVIEWINGELLGDGCLYSRSIYSASFTYGSKYKEYIDYVSNALNSFGIKQLGNTNKYYHKKFDCFSYNYASLYYEELYPIYKRWYPEGKKIIPKDIELTPLTCRQWFIGDGSLVHQKNNSFIELATCGFPVSDIEWLIEQFSKLGFKATRWISNRIGISTSSTKQFLDYIGKCPVECYQYKWKC